MGRRAEGGRTHGTPRHGGNELTPERSRARDRRQGLKERSGRLDVAHRRGAVGTRHARARARPARSPSEHKDQRAARSVRAAPLPDLAPLRTRIDDLVEESQKLSPLPATFESLRQRVDALDKGMNALRTEVAAVPKQLDASLNALKGAIVPRSPPVQVSGADIVRGLGAALFRDGKYPAAREVFLILVQNDPNDARHWYFAALANGLTSGNWAGDTESMVRKGLACEQKGMPKRSDIDAQFSTLTKEVGKDWLEEWRNRAPR